MKESEDYLDLESATTEGELTPLTAIVCARMQSPLDRTWRWLGKRVVEYRCPSWRQLCRCAMDAYGEEYWDRGQEIGKYAREVYHQFELGPVGFHYYVGVCPGCGVVYAAQLVPQDWLEKMESWAGESEYLRRYWRRNYKI